MNLTMGETMKLLIVKKQILDTVVDLDFAIDRINQLRKDNKDAQYYIEIQE